MTSTVATEAAYLNTVICRALYAVGYLHRAVTDGADPGGDLTPFVAIAANQVGHATMSRTLRHMNFVT